MFHHHDYADGEEFSGSENDDGFDEDLEALRRACMITGTDPKDLSISDGPTSSIPPEETASGSGGGDVSGLVSDSEDDLELVRKIQNRLALSVDLREPLSLEALCTLPPAVSDDEEDDFETLRVIQQRFSAYNVNNTGKMSAEDSSKSLDEVNASNGALENGTSSNLFESLIDACQGLPESKEALGKTSLLEDNEKTEASSLNEWHQSDTLAVKSSNFPKSAQAFIDAIKRNRSYQKFIRSKLTLIEAKMEENEKLKDRVKILKDFQVSLRKRTGKALSQKKDPCVQLFSAEKSKNSKDSENGEKKPSAMHCGPSENSQVANYRMALMAHPLSLNRKKWSKTERENLAKGIRQQFQETMLQLSVDQLSGPTGVSGDANNVDNIFASIKNLEISPEMIRDFIFKVDWDRVASMYVEGRSGAECETRWLNYEDPLINHNPWTVEEDKSLLFIVQERGIGNWSDIAALLGTNRTPFQCLTRYQRSLNASILKREWTEDEDEQLRVAVKAYGESNWQDVASALKGRTGTQCSNRWKKTLNPLRERVGRWSPDEDKRLKVATMLFGPKNWKKIAQFVPGRTEVQCRERWVNSLDPSVNRGGWTEDEDLKLEAAFQQHGNCWSKVAACLPSRTDNQCWRRWKALHPDEVPLLQAARKLRKSAIISNFVDRERERPALGPSDFTPLPIRNSVPEPEDMNSSRRRKRKPRGNQESGKEIGAAIGQKKGIPKKPKKDAQVCPEEILKLNDDEAIEATRSKKVVKPYSKKKNVEGQPGKAKKVFKRSSKRQKSAEVDGSSQQSNILEPSPSLEAGTPNGDCNNNLGESINGTELIVPDHSCCLNSTLVTSNVELADLTGLTDAFTKKRPRKLPLKRKSCTESGKEENLGLSSQLRTLLPPESLEAYSIYINHNNTPGGSINGTKTKMLDHPINMDSTSLTTNNVVHANASDGFGTSTENNRPVEMSLERGESRERDKEIINGTEMMMLDHPSNIDSTPVTIHIDQADEPNCFDPSLENGPSELPSGREKSMEQDKESLGLSSNPGILRTGEECDKAPRKYQRRKICKKSSRQCEAVNVPHDPCQQGRLKNLKPKSKSCSKSTPQELDGDDVTLAVFRCGKSKKRKLGASSCADLLSSPAAQKNIGSSSEDVDQHINKHQIPSITQNGDTTKHSDGGSSGNMLSNMLLKNMQTTAASDDDHIRVEKVVEGGVQIYDETDREPMVSSNLEDDNDITLACWRDGLSRRKKRSSHLKD